MILPTAYPTESEGELLLADGHVHLHACFEQDSLLEAAYGNLAQAARRGGHSDGFRGVLLLAEMAGTQAFDRIRAAAESDPIPKGVRWRFQRTGEPASVIGWSGDRTLTLIAGRQIVTAERIEVLALCTAQPFGDGLGLQETIRQVVEADGLPVLPWGVGKWLGRRGRLVARELEARTGAVELGDNSGRPRLWPRPRLFQLAARRGVRVLPGTDPLPLPGEAARVGSFGFGLFAALSSDRPAEDLKRVLRDRERPIFHFGALETTPRFLRNQLLIRLRR